MGFTAVVASITMLAGGLGAQTTGNARLSGDGGQGVALTLLAPSPETNEPLRFVLSEPAYVAAFIVYPGAGVQLLYPLVDQAEKIHPAGYNIDHLIGGSFDRGAYNVVLGPRAPNGPAYLYVVASRHPLDVARYVHKPMMLASAIGQKDSHSFYSDVAFDAVLDKAVKLGDDASWDSDMYALWDCDTPNKVAYASGGRPANPLPSSYPFSTCREERHLRPGDVVGRHVPQFAAADSMPAKTTARMANADTLTASPTVLPTIIGPHVSDAQRRADIDRARTAQQGAMITAANGDDGRATPADAPNQTQVEILDLDGRVRGRSEHHLAAERERFREQIRQQHQNMHVSGSPQLPPNPQLGPNPQLPPNPGMSSSQRQPSQPPAAPSTAPATAAGTPVRVP